jgi:2-iminobutanoate/2-iminopropanoate deaminase
MGAPGDPQLLVEISFVADKRTPRQAVVAPINADGTAGQPNPNYSAGLRVGNRFYVTGTLGNTAENAGDIKAQTRETIEQMKRVLTAGGFSLDDVVDARIYLTDMKNFADMGAAWRELFIRDAPARTTLQAQNMGRDGLVEIVMVASK